MLPRPEAESGPIHYSYDERDQTRDERDLTRGLWMGNDDGDDRGVEDEAEHRGPEVRMALLGLRVALHRWQGAQQDRQDPDRKADREQDRAPGSRVFTMASSEPKIVAVSTTSITSRTRGSASNALVASLLVSKNRIWNSRTLVLWRMHRLHPARCRCSKCCGCSRV